jgi:hypothetical protein
VRVPLWLDEVPFCTTSVGRSVDNWSPLTGETATGAVSVTGPDWVVPVVRRRPYGNLACGTRFRCRRRLQMWK